MIKRNCLQIALEGFLFVVLIIPIASAHELIWYSADSGGVVRATGGRFVLSGAVGQHDAAAQLSSSMWTLTGGFYFETPIGDCDEDGDVDGVEDLRVFIGCLSGPLDPVATTCRCFDSDGNGAIDLADFAVVQTTVTTP